MSEGIATINDAAAIWGPMIWRASWQGGIALLLALLVSRCLRNLSASFKCWIWRLAFCKLLVASMWITPVPLRWLPPGESPVRSLPAATETPMTEPMMPPAV